MDATAIDAPPLEDLTLDRTATTSGLFRSRLSHRAEIPPRPDQARRAPSSRAPLAGSPWRGIGRVWLGAVLVIGIAIFAWSVWSIFKTAPDAVNFTAGLIGIAAMAGPAYVLLGAGKR